MIRVVTGQLEDVDSEAILRPVDSQLEAVTAAGRGVEARAGPEVIERLRRMGDVPLGGAIVTPAGGLSASFLIHAVVRSQEEPLSKHGVRRALVNALRQASEWELSSLALPPLGAGPGSFDAETAAAIMVPVLQGHLRSVEFPNEIAIVVSSEYERDAFTRLLDRTVVPEDVENA